MPPKDYVKDREDNIKKLISREYKIYQEEERVSSLPRNVYERSCRWAAKANIKPDKKTDKKMQEAIDFAHMKITPTGVMSLTIIFLLVLMLPVLALTLTNVVFHEVDADGNVVRELIVFSSKYDSETGEPVSVSGFSGINFGYGALTIVIILFFTYYIYSYPYRVKRKYEVSAGSEIVTMILYMVMYMRNNPNLEGALRFAAENMPDDLGYELRKLLWDVEVGNYLSMQDAIIAYTNKWKNNRSFVEAVQLLVGSTKQVGERRLQILEEAVKIVLEGSREQARHFNQQLKMPVTVVHALGVILPIMGLVMFPIVSVFLKVQAAVLFVGYDILLPLVLYFVIIRILDIRPATFSKIDISKSPDVPPKGKMRLGGKYVTAWKISLVIGAVIIAFGVFLYFSEHSSLAEQAKQAGLQGGKADFYISQNFDGLLSAITITFGIALALGIYYISVSSQLLKVRAQTRGVEQEFAEALFQLGNQVSGGSPTEISMQNSIERIKTLKIKDLFEKALTNIKMLGLTFQQAFFDEKIGALRFYPSRMIRSVMRTVVEASKKGVSTASIAMLTVSRYLKNLHETQEEVKESLNDTLSSLKFQAYFLSPMIAGIVSTLAIIIIKILRNLGLSVDQLGSNVDILANFKDIPITPFEFVLVVGIYLIETSLILGMFINSIENGEDKIGEQSTTGHALIIGFVIFAIILFISLMIFTPLVTSLAVQ